MKSEFDPGALDSEPYSADRPRLPGSLIEAVDELDTSDLFRSRWGDAFIDYMVMMKRSEWGRFMSAVTDWEHREYFEVF